MLVPLRVLFTGAPDNGKSTLIGALLTYCHNVYEDLVETDLANYTDGLDSERANLMTVDLCYKTLVFPSGYRAILIDSPGHTELLHNFKCGASCADIVLHVIDCRGNQSPHLAWLRSNYPNLPVFTVMTKVRDEDGVGSNFSVDSYTGYGIPQLTAFLESMAQNNDSHNKSS